MRIARTRRTERLMGCHFHEGLEEFVQVGGEWSEVVRLGQGDPIVLVTGPGGRLEVAGPPGSSAGAAHQVILYELDGDMGPLGPPGRGAMAEYAGDLA